MLATAFLVAGVVLPVSAVATEPSPDEYAVFAALLSGWDDEGRSAFVVQRETTDAAHSRDFDEKTVSFLRKKFGDQSPPISLGDDLVESFRRIRNASVQLDPESLSVPNATIVASADLDAIFREKGWAAFRDRFGGAWGLIRLSRVGFSLDGTQALMSMSGSCGPLCGSGDYVLLRKIDGRWRVAARVMAWIS
jgi:hypothetical protein